MTRSRRYFASLMIVGCLMMGVMPAFAEERSPKNTFEPYVAVNDYEWKETDIFGTRAMKESGLLYSGGFTYTHDFASGLTLQPQAELFGGNVDYDGATQSGVPVKSTTTYVGFKLKGDAGWKFGEVSFIEPFAGLGLWYWSRTVDDSIAADGTIALGYTEDWTTFFGRLGVRGEAGSATVRWFGEGGVKIPFFNQNYAHIGSGITLHPGKQISFFAETGMIIHHFKASITYDGQRYSASDPSEGWYQPESTADQYGLKVGWMF